MIHSVEQHFRGPCTGTDSDRAFSSGGLAGLGRGARAGRDGRHALNPFRGCSPVQGTNILEFEWFVPKTGLQHYQ